MGVEYVTFLENIVERLILNLKAMINILSYLSSVSQVLSELNILKF